MVGDNNNTGNGGHVQIKIQRKDWIAIVVGVLAIVGGAFTVLLFVFQTKADSIAQHAAIGQDAALQRQAAELHRIHSEDRQDGVEKEIVEVKQILGTLDANQRILMQSRGIGRRAKPLPSGVSIDFDEED